MGQALPIYPKWIDVYARDSKVTYGVFTPACVESIARLPDLNFLILRNLGCRKNSPEALRYRINVLHRLFDEALWATDRFVQSSRLMRVGGRLDLMIGVDPVGGSSWTAWGQPPHPIAAERIH
ncbi:hypothetical protein FIU94_10315 [Sulfitobacter sp. THAF37]|uniref:hypothetical protein n=1 Tax=Sulfitobacter sp. THAF37 TaxID=2587855 RepID=UPI0012678470|nr:hypothetical protein [Sulfitobacter sp. THAF37]QFT59218.1 hypothetical protein FIU94_10315 [Sulfitobacter sp. THAF37]